LNVGFFLSFVVWGEDKLIVAGFYAFSWLLPNILFQLFFLQLVYVRILIDWFFRLSAQYTFEKFLELSLMSCIQ